MAAKEGEPATKQDEGLPEYVLRFHAPIVLHNLLPYPVTVTLTDARSNKSGGIAAQVGSWNIGVGRSEDVYFFDLTKKLKMGIEMQVSSPCPSPPAVMVCFYGASNPVTFGHTLSYISTVWQSTALTAETPFDASNGLCQFCSGLTLCV